MPTEEPPVTSLPELLRRADECQRRLAGAIWYRGQLGDDRLIPKVFRDDNARHEREWLNTFMCDAPARYSDCPPRTDLMRWLFLMQHHRLPTRLLDWTESVLVAAFFAVADKDKALRPVIWALAYKTMLAAQGVEPGVMTAGSPIAIVIAREAFRVCIPTVGEIAEEGHKIEGKKDLVLPIYPDQINPRMLMQQARFTLHRDKTPLEEHPSAKPHLDRIMIEPKAAPSIRFSLASLGICSSTLFPDLDHLAEDLIYFAPTGQGEARGEGFRPGSFMPASSEISDRSQFKAI